MRQSGAETLVTEEPYALIAHVRVCGGAGWVTAGSTRKESEPVVVVGDQVVISFVEATERHYVLTLAATQHDPLNGIVSMNDPTGHTLLNASVEDEIVLPWNGETRTAIVLQIKKQ